MIKHKLHPRELDKEYFVPNDRDTYIDDKIMVLFVFKNVRQRSFSIFLNLQNSKHIGLTSIVHLHPSFNNLILKISVSQFTRK